MPESQESAGLQRHFGLVHATALNISMIVGAGVFVTIPLMLGKLPGLMPCSAYSSPAA